MKYFEFTGKMIYCKPLNCSVNGNPAYFAIFENDNGNTIEGRTTPDAACSYGFRNYECNYRKVRYHITRSGNIRFDFIDVIRGNDKAVSEGLKLIPAIKKQAGNRENFVLSRLAKIEEVQNDNNYHVYRFTRETGESFDFETIGGKITG